MVELTPNLNDGDVRVQWTIGYRIRGGTRSRFSELYFRQLTPWTKEEIEEAEKTAIKLSEDAEWF